MRACWSFALTTALALSAVACAHDGPPSASGGTGAAEGATGTATAADVLDRVHTASTSASSVTPRPPPAREAAPDPDTAGSGSTAAAGSGPGTVAAGSGPGTSSPAGGEPNPRPEQPGEAPKKSTAVIPRDATAGTRNLAAIVPVIRQGVVTQPYGKTFAELYPKAPTAKTGPGVGGAASHPELSNDPIEVQAQVQYLDETKIEARYGHVSIRVVRVFRYGRLGATQIVLERIGREASAGPAFDADLAALAEAWKKPLPALGIDERKFRVARSDLFPLGKERPLRVVIEPESAEPDGPEERASP